jgi:hypothetical protein
LDDFRNQRPRAEQISIACELYPEVCQFVLASRGAWLGIGKTLPRALRALDRELGSLLEHGFERFFREGDRREAIAAVERALEPFGGTLFEGYRPRNGACLVTPFRGWIRSEPLEAEWARVTKGGVSG